MADNQRIDDLRRRVQKDPASIAFAQLAEEHRRIGQFPEAIDVCRRGLAIHPGYLSARVTLGRALVQINRLEEGRREFEVVLKAAPQNLAAVRGLAEIHERLGGDALEWSGESASPAGHSDPERRQPPRHVAAASTERTVAALEQFLTAIHVARAHRRA